MSEMFNLNTLGAYLWAFWAYIAKFGKLSKLGFKNLTFSWDCYPFLVIVSSQFFSGVKKYYHSFFSGVKQFYV